MAHQNGINLVMTAVRRPKEAPLAPRTIRFPERLRTRIAADAERCGRSFDAQVVAILRRHYGEDVDIAPAPDAVVALARGSLRGLSDAEVQRVTRRLVARDEK
jgi:predicted DNA-binding protein